MGKLDDRRNHRFAQKNLSALLDNELSERDLVRVRAHVDRCDICRHELETLEATAQALSELPRMSLPRSFAIPQEMVSEQQRVRRLDAGFAALRTAGVAVTVALVMVLSGDQLLARNVIPGPMAQSARQADMVIMAEADSPAYEVEVQTEAMQAPDGAEKAEVEALVQPESAPEEPMPEARAADAEEELTPEEIAARNAAPPGLGEGDDPRVLAPSPGLAAIPEDEAVTLGALPEDVTPDELAAMAEAAEDEPTIAEYAMPERVAGLERLDQAEPVRAILRQAMTILGGVAVVVFGGLVWLGQQRKL